MERPLSRREFLRRSGSLAGGAAFGAALPVAALGGSRSRPSPDAGPGRTLAALLAKNRALDPLRGRANHLSMSLLALSNMGGLPARLEDFAEKGMRGLPPFPSEGPPVDPSSWGRSLGNPRALRSFVSLFESEIRARGGEAVLRGALPILLPGVGSAAFHALIRTAYAVRFRNDEELAHGLAYWAATFGTLGPLDEAGKPDPDPIALLDRARRSPGLGGRPQRGRNIVDSMERAAALPGFAAISTALAVRPDSVERIADASLRLYVSTRDFTVLHLVTGTHAYRLIEPFAPDRDLGRRCFWQAVAAAYVGLGTPEVGPARDADAASWDAILDETRGRDDDHDLKLVDSCREEERVYGGRLYRRAAAARIGLA